MINFKAGRKQRAHKLAVKALLRIIYLNLQPEQLLFHLQRNTSYPIPYKKLHIYTHTYTYIYTHTYTYIHIPAFIESRFLNVLPKLYFVCMHIKQAGMFLKELSLQPPILSAIQESPSSQLIFMNYDKHIH